MNKKPIAITAAVVAVAAAGAGGVAIAANAGTDPIGELDAELVGGDTLVLKVEGNKDERLRFTYAGKTQTAQVEPVDGDDAGEDERDHVARFPAAAGDTTPGRQISVKVATTGSGADTKTLRDPLEVDTDGDDEETQAFATVAPVPSGDATAVRDLDADLVGGDTLVLTVEARDAKTVKLGYDGTTKTATPMRTDAGDRERDFTARFPAARGDRTDGARVAVKATAAGGGKSASDTLTDRVDVDDD